MAWPGLTCQCAVPQVPGLGGLSLPAATKWPGPLLALALSGSNVRSLVTSLRPTLGPASVTVDRDRDSGGVLKNECPDLTVTRTWPDRDRPLALAGSSCCSGQVTDSVSRGLELKVLRLSKSPSWSRSC